VGGRKIQLSYKESVMKNGCFYLVHAFLSENFPTIMIIKASFVVISNQVHTIRLWKCWETLYLLNRLILSSWLFAYNEADIYLPESHLEMKDLVHFTGTNSEWMGSKCKKPPYLWHSECPWSHCLEALLLFLVDIRGSIIICKTPFAKIFL
jgi:hypothetical protein